MLVAGGHSNKEKTSVIFSLTCFFQIYQGWNQYKIGFLRTQDIQETKDGIHRRSEVEMVSPTEEEKLHPFWGTFFSFFLKMDEARFLNQ